MNPEWRVQTRRMRIGVQVRIAVLRDDGETYDTVGKLHLSASRTRRLVDAMVKGLKNIKIEEIS